GLAHRTRFGGRVQGERTAGAIELGLGQVVNGVDLAVEGWTLVGAVVSAGDHGGAPDEGEAALWEEDYERRLFSYAAAQVRGDFRDATWQAFWQTGVQGQSAAEVAVGLGISV